ncbi:threonine/serine exporter family protein [Allofournierella sp.]|uniref:threonine/serine exporter family protein n=1 Tax=Allofournierella sp. TaxID=1940256 RepID=UPI003AB20884
MALQTGAGGAQGEALLACILDMGELLLVSGAEVRRVEDTLTRLCAAYGFERADVFTITSSIVLTAAAPGGRVLTQTRRIRERRTDLGCVERVNGLSRRLCAQPLALAGLRRAVEEVRQGRAYPPWVQCAAYAVVSAAFTVFFGGAARDALAAALSGALLAGALALGRRLPLGDLLLNLLCSAFAALAAAALAALGVGVSPEKIIIGNIMLLIPGLGLTVSLRDMIGGDTISGLLGLCEAVLKALAVAAGFAVVLLRAGG